MTVKLFIALHGSTTVFFRIVHRDDGGYSMMIALIRMIQPWYCSSMRRDAGRVMHSTVHPSYDDTLHWMKSAGVDHRCSVAIDCTPRQMRVECCRVAVVGMCSRPWGLMTQGVGDGNDSCYYWWSRRMLIGRDKMMGECYCSRSGTLMNAHTLLMGDRHGQRDCWHSVNDNRLDRVAQCRVKLVHWEHHDTSLG
jgi:hypothetical protein